MTGTRAAFTSLDQVHSLAQYGFSARPACVGTSRRRTGIAGFRSPGVRSFPVVAVVSDKDGAVASRVETEAGTLANRLRLGSLTEDGLSYKEKFIVRSYEVGINKTATVETIANLLQVFDFDLFVQLGDLEVGCNHAQSVGYSTMRKLRLIWVTLKYTNTLLGLKNLEVLDLSENGMSVTDILVCLNGLPSLKALYLSSNGFDPTYNGFNETFNVFETLSSKLLRLEILDVSENSLTNEMLPSLGGFTSLKELYLSHNELDSDMHIQGLCSMLKNLWVLDLSGNNFNDSDIASALSQLSSLKSLNLGYSELTPRSILNISKIRSLEILDIAGNSFSNEFLSSLSGLSRLKSLDLSSNQS
ncbi:hypothetical protein V8G54_015483 [Vigna mungo]|uniref:Acyl-[acyl-carrier-protein] hydrolase n=1 Tax=Vigna mungo TaxID=3915 RepID=A0AAQ3RZJ6_VIGMU